MQHNIEIVPITPDFSEADLAVNRNGRLSGVQNERFKRQRFLWIGLILIPGLSYVCLLALSLMDVPPQTQNMLQTIILLTILPGIYAVFRLIQLQDILCKGTVAVVQGIVQKSKVSTIYGNSAWYYNLDRRHPQHHLLQIQDSTFKSMRINSTYLQMDYPIAFITSQLRCRSYLMRRCRQKS